MWRDKRVQDNWALLYSQKMALDLNVPLQVPVLSFYFHTMFQVTHVSGSFIFLKLLFNGQDLQPYGTGPFFPL
jgi:hypothetical protein